MASELSKLIEDQLRQAEGSKDPESLRLLKEEKPAKKKLIPLRIKQLNPESKQRSPQKGSAGPPEAKGSPTGHARSSCSSWRLVAGLLCLLSLGGLLVYAFHREGNSILPRLSTSANPSPPGPLPRATPSPAMTEGVESVREGQNSPVSHAHDRDHPHAHPSPPFIPISASSAPDMRHQVPVESQVVHAHVPGESQVVHAHVPVESQVVPAHVPVESQAVHQHSPGGNQALHSAHVPVQKQPELDDFPMESEAELEEIPEEAPEGISEEVPTEDQAVKEHGPLMSQADDHDHDQLVAGQEIEERLPAASKAKEEESAVAQVKAPTWPQGGRHAHQHTVGSTSLTGATAAGVTTPTVRPHHVATSADHVAPVAPVAAPSAAPPALSPHTRAAFLPVAAPAPTLVEAVAVAAEAPSVTSVAGVSFDTVQHSPVEAPGGLLEGIVPSPGL